MTQINDGFTDAELRVLTEARSAMWKLEAFEFAYDANIRKLNLRRTQLDFLGVATAIFFLFLQYLATRESHPRLHDILGYVGTFLSLLLILLVVWGAFAKWPGQIEKKQELSRHIRRMLGEHRILREESPLNLTKMREWIRETEAFEEKRKHELATVPSFYLQRGFQHIGNKYMTTGLVCVKCERRWTPESNKRVWKTYLPSFFKCDSCGI